MPVTFKKYSQRLFIETFEKLTNVMSIAYFLIIKNIAFYFYYIYVSSSIKFISDSIIINPA